MAAGHIYVIATPIGNLADISYRAIKLLGEADRIVAEDTRHSQRLLHYYGITTPCYSLHAYNESKKTHSLIQKIQAGETMALISDAGTPVISDPGYYFIKAARQVGLSVIPVPGPCAAISALSSSGLVADQFYFIGFLPAKEAARYQQLLSYQTERASLVFYEAPHRILSMLETLYTVFGGERLAFIAREMTKAFESYYYGSLELLLKQVRCQTIPRQGEFVIVVEGVADKEPLLEMEEQQRVLSCLLEELPLKQAVSLAQRLTGISKNTLYKLALSLKDNHRKK